MAKRKYKSEPEYVEMAQRLMRDIKESLTRDADGNFPAKYAEIDWDGLNEPLPKTAWQEMDANRRWNMLCHCLKEGIWSLEITDGERLAREFVTAEERSGSYDRALAEANSRSTRSDKDKGPSR